MQLGVRGKLLAGFGTVIFFLLLVGGIGIYSVRQIGNGLNAVADVEMPGVIEVLETQTVAMQLQRDMRQIMLVSTPADNAKAKDAYLAAEKSYNEHLDALGGMLQSAEAKAKL